MTKSSLLLKILVAVAAGCLLVSCDPPFESELSLSGQVANFDATQAAAQTITVTSNDTWSASCPDTWVTVSPKSGQGNGSISISVADNVEFSARSSEVTVTTAGNVRATVKVNQLSPNPSILLSVESVDVEAAGKTVSVDVTSNAPWSLTIPSDCTWITADVKEGKGNGKVTFTVAANEAFTTRSADIAFTAFDKKASVKINQAAQTPVLELNPATVQVGYAGGSASVDVTSNAPWTVTIPDGCTWVTADVKEGTGNGKVSFLVSSNLVRETRTAVVTFKESAAGTEKTVAISQEMAPLSRYTDSLVLVAIYNAADGAQWKAGRTWDLSTPMDGWYGVVVREDRVTSLKIGTKTITAKNWEIPASISDLDQLDTLTLASNMVTGNFPEALYELRKLKVIDLSGNSLTGSFSSKMGQWTALEYITMLNNKNFGGEIPKEIGQLKKLFRFNASNTSISGAIPAELAGCESLQEFMIFSAKLSGTLPDIWDQFKKDFKILMLYGNTGLEGPLPASLGNVKSSAATISYHLYNCNFTGNIPESFANLPSGCKQLRIQGNRMSGVVPDAVRAHANWTTWKPETYIFPQQDGYGLE